MQMTFHSSLLQSRSNGNCYFSETVVCSFAGPMEPLSSSAVKEKKEKEWELWEQWELCGDFVSEGEVAILHSVQWFSLETVVSLLFFKKKCHQAQVTT
jgi:hypothetical protein